LISVVEVRRILNEWRVRLNRVQAIIQPPVWNELEWKQFARVLVGLVQRNGSTWSDETHTYWDLRWKLKDGGDLIVQMQAIPDQELQLVVAQQGGFIGKDVESYTWFWSVFTTDGEFARDPFVVEGTWKEALMQLLLPYQFQAGYYLAGTQETPQELLLQNNATPGYHDGEIKQLHSADLPRA